MTLALGAMAAGATLTGMAGAIQRLYQMGSAVNEYIDNHIVELKGSANQTMASTGRVLEGAKFGFGIGFMSYMTIVATGQLILGNELGAAVTVVSAPVNPLAMSCAAVGAIYYGWGALSIQEQEAMLDRLSKGLELGLELIRAIIGFVIKTLKNLMSSKRLVEFKQDIESQAALFGKSLYNVTHQMADMATGAAKVVKGQIEKVADKTVLATVDAKEHLAVAAEKSVDAANKVVHELGKAAAGMKDRVDHAISRRGSAAKPIAAPAEVKPVDADRNAQSDEPPMSARANKRGQGQT